MPDELPFEFLTDGFDFRFTIQRQCDILFLGDHVSPP